MEMSLALKIPEVISVEHPILGNFKTFMTTLNIIPRVSVGFNIEVSN